MAPAVVQHSFSAAWPPQGFRILLLSAAAEKLHHILPVEENHNQSVVDLLPDVEDTAVAAVVVVGRNLRVDRLVVLGAGRR